MLREPDHAYNCLLQFICLCYMYIYILHVLSILYYFNLYLRDRVGTGSRRYGIASRRDRVNPPLPFPLIFLYAFAYIISCHVFVCLLVSTYSTCLSPNQENIRWRGNRPWTKILFFTSTCIYPAVPYFHISLMILIFF